MVIVPVLFARLGVTPMNKLIVAALLGSLLAAPVMAAQFYKWTDEKGATHYSESPPPATAKGATEIKVQTRTPSGSGSAVESLQKQRETTRKNLSEKTKAGATDAAATKVDKSEYAERCKQYRSNLEAMESHGRVSEMSSKGEKRFLTDEEKNKRMDETRRQIKAFCQ